jgi:pathogenesis-related protein 1
MNNDTTMWLAAVTFALALGTVPACGGSSQGTGGSGTGGTTGSTTGSGNTGDPEPPDMVGMTAAHNAARAAVMPAASPPLPPMAWSTAVAKTSQAFTDDCVFADTSNGYGSNAFAGTGTYTPADVVKAWVSEDADYTYATNTCASGKECGHYTQVVWRDSVGLGCGMTQCTENNPFTSDGSGAWVLWVCDYDPAGNYVGMKPY